MDESKRDVSVDFAGEGVVDGVSSVDASAGGLDLMAHQEWYSRFLRGRFVVEAKGVGLCWG